MVRIKSLKKAKIKVMGKETNVESMEIIDVNFIDAGSFVATGNFEYIIESTSTIDDIDINYTNSEEK